MDLLVLTILSAASLVALLCAFGAMRIYRPRNKSWYDLWFASVFSLFLFLIMFSVTQGARRHLDADRTMVIIFMGIICMLGVFASVGMHCVGALYDTRILLMTIKPVKRTGWPWQTLSSSVTHVLTGLSFVLLGVVGMSLFD